MSDHIPKEPNNINTTLSIDLTNLILSSLPIPSLIRASSVCKLWFSLISSPSFTSHSLSHPWFFLFGLHNTSSKNNQSFAFDPLSNSWFNLPSINDSSSSSFLGSNGFFFTTTPKFSYTPLLKSSWRLTPHWLTLFWVFSKMIPLVVGLVSNSLLLVVLGSLEAWSISKIGWLSKSTTPTMILGSFVLLYRPIFGPVTRANLFHRLNGKFYVFGIHSNFVSSFDLRKHVWSNVQTLRPPGVIFSFMISCNEMLVLAGMCNAPRRGPSFSLWRIDETTMELSEIAIMPQSLLYSLVDDEEDDKFASLILYMFLMKSITKSTLLVFVKSVLIMASVVGGECLNCHHLLTSSIKSLAFLQPFR